MSTKRTGPLTLDPVSKSHLKGVHPDLIDVVAEAAMRCRFRLTEGVRTKERQKMLVSQRKSKTMNSRHITGHAVDFIAINGKGFATYNANDMIRVSNVFKQVAAEKGIDIEWGGDWRSKPSDKIGWDSPHIQLSWKAYPANAVGVRTRVFEAARDHPKTTGAIAIGTVEAAQQAEPVATSLLEVPSMVSDGMARLSDWMGVGDGIASAVAWIGANPVVAVLCLLWASGAMLWPKIREAKIWDSLWDLPGRFWRSSPVG